MSLLDPHSYTDLDQGTIKHVDLALTADFEERCLRGTATLTLERKSEGPIDLDTRDVNIAQIVDGDGSELSWTLAPQESFMGSKLRIELGAQTKKVTVAYATSPSASALQWLEPQQTAGGKHPYLFSQAQPIHARAMAPLQDSPYVRFSYTAEITVPAPLVAVMSAAPGEKLQGSRGDTTVYRFEMKQAIPAYLLALAVGNLTYEDLSPRCRVYTEPEMIEAAAWEFEDAEKMVQSAEGLFGPYLWERFDFLVMPPSFPLGGMENPRLTFLTPTLLAGDRSLVNLLAHELAHSWTGNLVTNATMNDFWLNEGFTVWAERRILEELFGKEAASLAATIGRNGLDGEMERFGADSVLTHLKNDLKGIDPDEIFSVVPYEKGFLLVTLLEQTVGRDKFDGFIREYIDHFSFTSITTQQFEAYFESKFPGTLAEVNGEAWIHGPGIPANSPAFKSDALDEINALAAGWSDGVRPDPQKAVDWSADLWQIFLQALPKTMPLKDCRWLDETFDLSNRKNTEILANWLEIAATSAYEPTFERIEQFLGSMGRMKFLKMLYVALSKNEITLNLGKRILDKNAESYHPLGKGTAQRALGLAGK